MTKQNGSAAKAPVHEVRLGRIKAAVWENTTENGVRHNVTICRLYEHGYRRRKPQKKRTMGQHADRNAQFERIAELKQEYLDAGKPVISIDSKKKEILGNFHRGGITDAVDPTIVNDHDFASSSDGKVIPHGIYDVAENEASLHLRYQPRHERILLRQHRVVAA